MTANKDSESEVKILFHDLAMIEQRLKFLGATLAAPRILERNIRYDDVEGSFAAANRVLRLRQDSRARLTLKEPGTSSESSILSRPEYEVEVSDFDTTHLILKHLGFHEMWMYEKYRTTYEYGGCEIVLDEMPYGNFVEVEGVPDLIEETLELLGLSSELRVAASYSDLFFRLKQSLGLTFRDLTFENFLNITVPAELLHTMA